MSIYSPLCDYLKNSGKPTVTLTFSNIAKIIGNNLPAYASQKPWWSNHESHSQAKLGWLAAGYEVTNVDLANQTVTFTKTAGSTTLVRSNYSEEKKTISNLTKNTRITVNQKDLTVNGYIFHFVDDIRPERDQRGKIIEYKPQNDYEKRDAVPLNKHGHGSFCKFSIKAEEISGVYLWVENDEIIYIGEAVNFKQRFNTGYGNISPKNCYEGGQPTNCKMNKVALEESKKGNTISIYFYATPNHKAVEKILLSKINTPYNVKDN